MYRWKDFSDAEIAKIKEGHQALAEKQTGLQAAGGDLAPMDLRNLEDLNRNLKMIAEQKETPAQKARRYGFAGAEKLSKRALNFILVVEKCWDKFVDDEYRECHFLKFFSDWEEPRMDWRGEPSPISKMDLDLEFSGQQYLAYGGEFYPNTMAYDWGHFTRNMSHEELIATVLANKHTCWLAIFDLDMMEEVELKITGVKVVPKKP